MKQSKIVFTVVLTVVAALPLLAVQSSVAVLAGAELTKVIPAAFYFQGQSAPTQMRNAAAARSGTNRYVIAGMVDTSGYSTEVRAKYEGFFITDSPITLGGSDVAVGAYGFGFSNDGKLNLLDLGGNQILSVATTKDSALRRPRPLMMTKSGQEIRFYSGRDYAVIAFK